MLMKKKEIQVGLHFSVLYLAHRCIGDKVAILTLTLVILLWQWHSINLSNQHKTDHLEADLVLFFLHFLTRPVN